MSYIIILVITKGKGGVIIEEKTVKGAESEAHYVRRGRAQFMCVSDQGKTGRPLNNFS